MLPFVSADVRSTDDAIASEGGDFEYTQAQLDFRAQAEGVLRGVHKVQVRVLGTEHEDTVLTAERLELLLHCTGNMTRPEQPPAAVSPGIPQGIPPPPPTEYENVD